MTVDEYLERYKAAEAAYKAALDAWGWERDADAREALEEELGRAEEAKHEAAEDVCEVLIGLAGA